MEIKLGIWVGKFESSGSNEQVQIIPNTDSLKGINLGVVFTAYQGVKNTYNLTGDSHMMKNIEWGAVAYLAESRYGRNGTEVTVNNKNSMTGQGDYVANVTQSTTGNIYGIYDMNGTSWEFVAGVYGKSLYSGNYDFRKTDSKKYNS